MGVGLSLEDADGLLRARGLRSTAQRRAILSMFSGHRTEHLSADEIYAHASHALAGISRATVYATLAEFGEAGLIAAFGTPEPVRYEINLNPHPHFRCDVCLRIFNLQTGHQRPEDITDDGFTVLRVETRAEGVCDECNAYDDGLREGVRQITSTGALEDALPAGTAVSQLNSPLGPLLLGATSAGLIRLAFTDHGDADLLTAHLTRRRGSQKARAHLALAQTALTAYFDGTTDQAEATLDWDFLGPEVQALTVTQRIAPGSWRSYHTLDQPLAVAAFGREIGRNPIPIFLPCHRVRRGTQTPSAFVGGLDRRAWLDSHERGS